jgi:hypothetical protein
MNNHYLGYYPNYKIGEVYEEGDYKFMVIDRVECKRPCLFTKQPCKGLIKAIGRVPVTHPFCGFPSLTYHYGNPRK